MAAWFKTGTWFLLLLPLFFVLHSYTGHFNFVPPDAFFLAIIYAVAAYLMEAIFWLLLKNVQKAGIAAFFVMAYFLFFGSVKDKLQAFLPGIFLWHYSFLLPAGVIIIAVITVWLKKTKKPVYRFVYYLNVLFAILILTDAGRLTYKIIRLNNSSDFSMPVDHFTACDTCYKPDIYFIVLDEYAGNKELTGRLHFDNAAFENELKNKGFHVIKESISNYNATVFSMASILNMNYLDFNDQRLKGENYNYAYRAISESQVVKFFTANGYDFQNYSFLNFPGKPALAPNNFLPGSNRLVVGETLLGRIMLDYPSAQEKEPFEDIRNTKPAIYRQLENNESLTRYTLNQADKTSSRPRFIYTHLMMPHSPFYFNSKGVLQSESALLNKENKTIDHQYTEYLQYCNGIIVKMVNDILAGSHTPPVILLLGDHGYRNSQEASDSTWCFYNLNAVFFPDKRYDQFYDHLSNVNHFRVVFNKLFRQQLPLLKDSAIYIRE